MTNPKKATHGVMIDVLPKGTNISSFEKFIKIDDVYDIDDKDYISYKQEYEQLINDNKLIFKKILLLEQLIIQNRCFQTVHQSIKLYIVRDYIYAKALFYRHDNEVDDIRIVAGKLEEYGDNIEELLKNDKFMDIAYDKLYDAMEKEILKTEEEVKQLEVMYHI